MTPIKSKQQKTREYTHSILHLLSMHTIAIAPILYNREPGCPIRIANSLYCEKKRKRSEFASHRFLAQGVRFASLSLFKGSNSQKSENCRLILAIIFQKKAILSGWNLSFFRYLRENYGKNNQDRERGLLSVRNLFGKTNFFTNGADFF